MQQQIRTQTPKKNKPAASLIISWLIILGVYLLLRLVFVIFGFHLAPVVLGGCLAILPYIAGAFYLFKTPAAHRVGGCVLGILLPSIVEKLVLYFDFLGQFLADVCCVIDPEAVLLGGGVSKAGQPLLDGVRKYFLSYMFHTGQDIFFALAKLGNDAGIYGSFKLALDAFGR